ncbi:MAG: PEP-CTERM system histidine kinase PrsK [Porticoccaceae bacterium]
MNLGVISYLFAFIAYLALMVLVLFSWRGRVGGGLIILALLVSSVWAGVVSLAEMGVPISFEVMQLAELVRSLLWCLFLFYAMEKSCQSDGANSLAFRVAVGIAGLLVVVGAAFALPFSARLLPNFGAGLRDAVLTLWVALSIVVLVLIEQIFRNATETLRWSVKFLCLGVGGFFAYDLFMYADALLFKKISLNLWESRGFVNGMVVPLIAIAIARNPRFEVNLHVSRNVVFHTATIIGAGVYLLSMAVAGYFIRFYGGNWGAILQVVFFSGALVLLLILVFSDRIRAKFRVFLSKHFFSYKHDYREEWLKFTRNLAEGEDSVPGRVIQSIAKLTSSSGGMLWEKNELGQYDLLYRWHMPEPEGVDAHSLESLARFLDRTHWVVDFDEYYESRSVYGGLVLPEWLLSIPNAWLIVPLVFRDECLGFVLVRRSELQSSINWEDRDLLKMAGQHAASHLAQYQSDQELMRSRQFEAFHRLSAYIVHDLKNILAQQSLIVANAERHKHKEEFVDDVISTVKNSVDRMTRLMDQMRSGVRGEMRGPVILGDLLARVASNHASRLPVPRLEMSAGKVVVDADREHLGTVFGHLIANAQDATPKDGSVVIEVKWLGDKVCVDVMDTGVGMDRDFIRDRLFKPFDSTKGLVGMGVGAFESREYIRSLGGDILVDSQLGAGSTFSILLPADRLDVNDTRKQREGVNGE